MNGTLPPDKLKELLAATNPPLWTLTVTFTLPPWSGLDWYGKPYNTLGVSDAE